MIFDGEGNRASKIVAFKGILREYAMLLGLCTRKPTGEASPLVIGKHRPMPMQARRRHIKSISCIQTPVGRLQLGPT